MFADAVEKAMSYTFPVVVSRRGYEESCSSAIGSYVVLNKDGWIVTAAHILDSLEQLKESKTALKEYEQKRAKVEADKKLPLKRRRAAIKKLGGTEKLTRNFSVWWGLPNPKVVMAEGTGVPKVDLAVARLEPFDPGWVKEYPVFKDPQKPMRSGTSLCRLGFPLHTIEPTFDEASNSFIFPEAALPLPIFPIEGIFTRNIRVGKHPSGFTLAYLETSSPGLKGQSGGPIFDREGTVWAIQSLTKSYELGFTPSAKAAKDKDV
jgi:hypothetical protein